MKGSRKNKAVAAYYDRSLQAVLGVTDAELAEIDREVKGTISGHEAKASAPKILVRVGRWLVERDTGLVVGRK